ncbi:phage tail assembly chaperone G [Enterococcus sp. AZ103]|uniref:phage tail assembly chaperone G n=1 Tax=Enterococcus sp. AZ103 TaxID=2774628 RepID=UPI003F27A9AB
MLELKQNGDIKVTVTINNKKKVFLQDKVPIKKALAYTSGEAALFEKAFKEGRTGATESELLDYRLQFLADLFEDDQITKEILLDELDTLEIPKLFEIINYRVLGNEKKEEEISTNDPKE